MAASYRAKAAAITAEEPAFGTNEAWKARWSLATLAYMLGCSRSRRGDGREGLIL
jgi:hypothetical protein